MIQIKTPAEIEIMKEGGKKLAAVKDGLRKAVKVGVSAKEIDDLADKLIEKEGAESSFKKVPGYRWSTCVNTNDGVVHGIPHASVIFKKGDLVSVDVGVFYKGFHTDTSFSTAIEPTTEIANFLKAGEEALKNAIKEVKVGNKIYDISKAIEDTLRKHKVTPIEALVGHGVGKELHEDPQIPCYTRGSRDNSPTIPENAVLAVEVMYTAGKPDIYVDGSDKWTIFTRDGKIASLFEETVAVLTGGSLVLTS